MGAIGVPGNEGQGAWLALVCSGSRLGHLRQCGSTSHCIPQRFWPTVCQLVLQSSFTCIFPHTRPSPSPTWTPNPLRPPRYHSDSRSQSDPRHRPTRTTTVPFTRMDPLGPPRSHSHAWTHSDHHDPTQTPGPIHTLGPAWTHSDHHGRMDPLRPPRSHSHTRFCMDQQSPSPFLDPPWSPYYKPTHIN